MMPLPTSIGFLHFITKLSVAATYQQQPALSVI
jgi:hypothetical protein